MYCLFVCCSTLSHYKLDVKVDRSGLLLYLKTDQYFLRRTDFFEKIGPPGPNSFGKNGPRTKIFGGPKFP